MTRAHPTSVRRTLDVALVIPLRGSAGLFGPSCELCARLAAEEVNAVGGVGGRELRLTVVDGAGAPARVADEVEALVAGGRVEAVVGWHISAVRQVLAPRLAGHVPYVYTALYEGGERNPGVLLLGETPRRQLLPAMRYLRKHHGVRRWCVVGDDYVWPRVSARAARTYAALCGGEICEEIFVPLGTADFATILPRVAASRPDAVLMLLVGEDAIHFNRAFARAGLDERCRRLSTLMDETMLLGSGAESTRGLSAAAGYFETLPTAESLAFNGRYASRYSAEAPALNSLGESCYEGVLLLAALIGQAGSLRPRALGAAAESVTYTGPRGELRLRDRHVEQRVYLADADALRFDIVAEL